MTKEKIYTYLGTNGIVSTPIHIEGVSSICKIFLKADEGKVLTKDYGTTFYNKVVVPEAEVELWIEVDNLGQI